MLVMPGAELKGTRRRVQRPMHTKGTTPTTVSATIRANSTGLSYVAQRDTDHGEQRDDKDAEEHSGAALGEDVSERRHGTGALEIEPSGGEIGGQADPDAEEGCAYHAEYGIAGEDVLGDGDGADVLSAVHDNSEEEIEHDGEADDGEGEAARAHEAHEFVAGFAQEDWEAARERLVGGDSWSRWT